MIRSMTGYGRAENHFGTKKVIVELRSLNSKQLDLSVKMPSVYREKEYEIRTMIASKLGRGKVEIAVSTEDNHQFQIAPINQDAFQGYYDQIKEVCKETGISLKNEQIISTILRLPEVVNSEKNKLDEAEYKVLMDTVNEALDNIDAFRLKEGDVLINDLRSRVDKIFEFMKSIEPFEGQRINVVRDRITSHLENAAVQIDNNRLEQELIFYIEKYDITEEKVRLTNHCKYFHEVSLQEGMGRKLGFIAQEMGREINTIGSKANDSNIQRIVVEMKDELEKIKEQLFNIL